MTDLAKRYGAPNPVRKRILTGFVVLLALAGLSWLAWAATYQSAPEVDSEMLSWKVTSEHEATARFTVVRKDTDVSATCFVRAIAADHAEVGAANVTVDAGAKTQTVEVTIRTERAATSVQLTGCTAPGQTGRR